MAPARGLPSDLSSVALAKEKALAKGGGKAEELVSNTRIRIFLPQRAQRTRRREISCLFLSWDSLEALKDHPGCPKSPCSKRKKNSGCSVSSGVKESRSIHHEDENDEDWVGPEWATTRREPARKVQGFVRRRCNTITAQGTALGKKVCGKEA